MSHETSLVLLRRIAAVWGVSTGTDPDTIVREVVPFLRRELDKMRTPPSTPCRLDNTLHDVLNMLIDSVEHRARVEKENVR